MSMIIRELREFVVLDFWGQKFIQQRIIILPADSTKGTKKVLKIITRLTRLTR